MDIYQAIFTAPEDIVMATRAQFIRAFGADRFDKLIGPYLDFEIPAFIFSAPLSPHVYWFLDRLCKNFAQVAGEVFTPPPEFLAIAIPENEKLVVCPKCGISFREDAKVDATRFNESFLCLRCYIKSVGEETNIFIEKLNGQP